MNCKTFFKTTALMMFSVNTCYGSFEDAPLYTMKTAHLVGEEVLFDSVADFDEALNVGFCRIKTPDHVNVEAGRNFARTFNQMNKYKTFGNQGPVNGYILSELAQTVRFTLESEHWDKEGWGSDVSLSNPNYSEEIQTLGHSMKNVGLSFMKGILKKFELPQTLWSQATAGSVDGFGSYYLNFNYYDPTDSKKEFGLGAHKDWGYITVLDATEPGLQANINGTWHSLNVEDGYLTINFGEPLQKLLPGVNASLHRVLQQSHSPRISTVMFIDPRVGDHREGSPLSGPGMVWDWNPQNQTLENGESTLDYFGRLSSELYGKTGN